MNLQGGDQLAAAGPVQPARQAARGLFLRFFCGFMHAPRCARRFAQCARSGTFTLFDGSVRAQIHKSRKGLRIDPSPFSAIALELERTTLQRKSEIAHDRARHFALAVCLASAFASVLEFDALGAPGVVDALKE